MIDDILKKAEQFNQAARQERLRSPQVIQQTHAVRFSPAIVSDLFIFEVQTVAVPAVDGVYLCHKQTTFGVFGPPNIEVFNLLENYTIDDYTPALTTGDKIAAWQMPDADGVMRWVGFPLVPCVRMVRATQSAGGEQKLTCNLVPDGETEKTSGLGSEISVYWEVCGGSEAADRCLVNASPRFSDNDYSFAVNISGKWHCVGVAQASEDRPCG